MRDTPDQAPLLDTPKYRGMLLAKQHELVERLRQNGREAREIDTDDSADFGDRGLEEQIRSDNFGEAQADWNLLHEVQDALRRIHTGAYGRCMADNQPIPVQRLDAVPWTRYCLRHEQQREAGKAPPTL